MKKITILLVACVYVTMMSCKHNNHSHEDHNNSHEAEQHNHDDHNHGHNDEHQHNHGSEHEHDSKHDHSHDIENELKHEHEYKMAKVHLQDFNQIIKVSGEIKAAHGGEIAVVASNSGTVHFVDKSMVEGKYLTKGQIIFNISGKDLTENNISIKYNQTKAAYEKAKSKFERAQQLNQNKIISDKELEQAKSDYLSIKSEYDVITKTYNHGEGTVIVPEKSFIKEFFVEEGQFVEVGEKLACLIVSDKLRLVAEVSQKYQGNLTDIRSATFKTVNDGVVYDTRDLNGKLLSYGKSFTANSYYIPVIFEIDYHKELFPGSFAQIFLKGKKEENQLVVPKTALVEEQENYFVYVEKEHDQFEKRHVLIGNQDGKNVVITDGVHEGEVIVTEGVYFVKLASMSNALPAHSHSH